ncbi:hypothetical protein [Lysinibacillus sphaericus]|uniref:hypothetical protein n=1 Tax=Lysinibacillus sphaericus TaxID=1421 RepID=UPI001A9FB5D4|nr:hypothetical protein [Lysinibacillus sphaericus]QTB26323.1 hypothetical protein J2D51_19075 [Lysinibacillus sphaericus]
MAKSKLDVLQNELRDRLRILQEDIDDIQHGDEYDMNIYKETMLEIDFLKKILNRIWDIKHN